MLIMVIIEIPTVRLVSVASAPTASTTALIAIMPDMLSFSEFKTRYLMIGLKKTFCFRFLTLARFFSEH